MLTSLLIAAAVGYLLGSLPFGYLVARSKGVNIFEVGSKSSGATNVRRVLGNGPGYLVLGLDAAKGAMAIAWFPIFMDLLPRAILGTSYWQIVMTSSDSEPYRGFLAVWNHWIQSPQAIVGLLAALVGHSFSCFTRFKGGKGVATGAGGFAVLFPLGALIAVITFALLLALTRYVSLASMLAAATLPVSAWLLHRPALIIGACAVVAVFVAVRHRANISRLLAGTESKIGRKSNAAES